MWLAVVKVEMDPATLKVVCSHQLVAPVDLADEQFPMEDRTSFVTICSVQYSLARVPAPQHKYLCVM